MDNPRRSHRLEIPKENVYLIVSPIQSTDFREKKNAAAWLGSQKATYKSRDGILDNDSHTAGSCAPATTADILFGGRRR